MSLNRLWIFSAFILIFVLISQYECEAKVTVSFGNGNRANSSSLTAPRNPSSKVVHNIAEALAAAILKDQRKQRRNKRRRPGRKNTTPKPKVECTISPQGVEICSTVANVSTTPSPPPCVNTVYPHGIVCEPRREPPPPGCFPSIVNGKAEFPRPECRKYFPELGQGKNVTKDEAEMFNFLSGIANSGSNNVFGGENFGPFGLFGNASAGQTGSLGNRTPAPNYAPSHIVVPNNNTKIQSQGRNNTDLGGMSLLDFLTLYVGGNPNPPVQSRSMIESRSGFDFEEARDLSDDNEDYNEDDNVRGPGNAKSSIKSLNLRD